MNYFLQQKGIHANGVSLLMVKSANRNCKDFDFIHRLTGIHWRMVAILSCWPRVVWSIWDVPTAIQVLWWVTPSPTKSWLRLNCGPSRVNTNWECISFPKRYFLLSRSSSSLIKRKIHLVAALTNSFIFWLLNQVSFRCFKSNSENWKANRCLHCNVYDVVFSSWLK